jgi:large subunit ribosomal protein L18
MELTKKLKDKNKAKQKRHKRVRKKIFGTKMHPRLCVYRSLKHIYAQLIDDSRQETLLSVSSLSIEVKKGIPYGGNIEAAKKVGLLLASKAKEKGINEVVFDRGGYKYHGRIKALAEAAREGGLKF